MQQTVVCLSEITQSHYSGSGVTETLNILNDILGDKERAVYTFDRYDIKGGKITPLNDGSHIVYVNGEYIGNDPVRKLIHDLLCDNPNEMYYKELAKRAKYFKQNEPANKKSRERSKRNGQRY